jgi:hypothetical protein
MNNFCTLFDSGYLIKGVAMLKSLARFCPGARVYVLCMDARAQEILEALALPGVVCIPLADIEDAALLEAKKDRSIAEYCWTLTPCLPWHVLRHNPDIDFITYVDADLLFYSTPQPLFDEIGDSSIVIIEHRFTPSLKKELEVNGRFCVEWVGFRRNEEGMACLSRWREQCIEWCHDRLEDLRFGDQKYLDEWPDRYRSCHILQHVGAGVAPWNYAQYAFGEDSAGHITVQGAPLIFYHFHQFKLLDNGGFDRLSAIYASVCPEPALVYELYESTLVSALAEVREIVPGFSSGLKPAPRVATGWARWFAPRVVKDFLNRVIGAC